MTGLARVMLRSMVMKTNTAVATPAKLRDGSWGLEGYWNVVIGDTLTADDAVREFGLDKLDDGEIDAWLRDAEAEAWRAGGEGGGMPSEWAAHHARTLADLQDVRAAR